MGSDSGEPSAEQLREMQAMVERAMSDGAVGLSTGLGYFPGMIAKPAELAALARVAAAAGGVLTSHLRAYSVRSLFFDSRIPHNILAIREMAGVAREAGVPLQVSHLIFVGRRTWTMIYDTLAEVERHRQRGRRYRVRHFPLHMRQHDDSGDFSRVGANRAGGFARFVGRMGKIGTTVSGRSVPFIAESIQLMWAVKPELSHLEGKFFSQIADESETRSDRCVPDRRARKRNPRAGADSLYTAATTLGTKMRSGPR